MYHRHAFLIMAHNNWYTLEKLMLLLDAPWSDIYLHIDKKSRNFDNAKFQHLCNNASVHFVKRHSVIWGNETQIKAEMELFRSAHKNGPYWYYHFLSGTDLPLKSIDEIYQYFDKTQSNFLQVVPADKYEWRLQTYINVFRQSYIPTSIRKKLNAWTEILQYKFHINRLIWLKKHYPKFGKGHNWCDLTQPAVEALIKASKDIIKFTRFTHCSDELYKQIILLNDSELSKSISPIDIRKIDWSDRDNHPKTYTIEDCQIFISTQPDEYIFARKFDDATTGGGIDLIFKHLTHRDPK